MDIVINAFSVFELLISEDYEGKFLKHVNLKDIIMHLTMENIILNNNICVNMWCCGISSDELVKKCLSTMSNILLNNYCKIKNDNQPKKSNKRKLNN